MLRPDKEYKEFKEKADAGVSFLDAKIKENKEQHWITASELSQNASAPQFLINNILETKTHGLLAGGSQAFKSFMVLKMAHCICTGHDFFGHDVYETGKVLYVCGEGMGALGRRIRAINLVDGDVGDNLIIKRKPLNIDNIADMNWLRQQINDIRPVLVVFDTFSSLATSTKENVNEEVARALRMVTDACSDDGASSIVVHHYGKDADKGSRGASAFSANVDFEFSMARADKDNMMAVLSCKKSKDGEYFDDITVKAHIVDLGLERQDGTTSKSLILKQCDAMSSLTDRQEKVLLVISNLINTDGIVDFGHLGVNETQIRQALNAAFHGEVANKYKIFNENIPVLISKGKLAEKESFFWLK